MTELYSDQRTTADSRRLLEGLSAEEQAELGNLAEVTHLLSSYDTPQPPDPSLLLATLTPLVQARATNAPTFSLKSWLRLVRTQALLFEPAFWIANTLVFALGLSLALLQANGWLVLTFVYAAPILTIAAVAYAFRPATRGLWELEQLSPVRPLELLYARLILVLAVNSLIALVLLTLIWANTPGLILWRLLIVWFGPMLGIASAALYLSLRFGSLIGISLPALTWIGLMMVSWQQSGIENLLPGEAVQTAARWLLAQVSTSNTLLIGSLLLLAAAIFLLSRMGQLIPDTVTNRDDHQWS